ncbi:MULTISPECIES: Tc toxin subunit A-related protein [unclassified Microcoleus]|uniref:Tc toxin subunit A-related protein n=1 Tax=unclassified Microcoleus TaxID=2642155 RepID=UPI002FD3AB29
MEPKYMRENRYSYLTTAWRQPLTVDYQAETPETIFERKVQQSFLEGHKYLHQEEFGLALDVFREVQALILKTVHPQLPINPWKSLPFVTIDAAFVDAFVIKAGDILNKTPAIKYQFPASLISEQSILPAAIQKQLEPVVNSGLQVTSFHQAVSEKLAQSLLAVDESEWTVALKGYEVALQLIPQDAIAFRAALLHDMAIFNEKANNKELAIRNAELSTKLFTEAKLPEGQFQALSTSAKIYARAGQQDKADAALKSAKTLSDRFNLDPVVSSRRELELVPINRTLERLPNRLDRVSIPSTLPSQITPRVGNIVASTAVQSFTDRVSEIPANALVLMAPEYLKLNTATKSLTIQGETTATAIALNANATVSVRNFHQLLATTTDLELLTGFDRNPAQMVAYLPHMYFFVIPMAIGDCLMGLGNLSEAEQQYLSVLPYPFINREYEIVKLWTRLAEVCLDMGDAAYRRAKDNVAAFAEAKQLYEKIVQSNNTLDSNSSLYKDVKFAAVKNRITNFLGAKNPVTHNDNPVLLIKVMEARTKLNQINAGLNFFGFAPNYVPPFSFEYLQTTARYFSQQASQIEQRYIQYKSTAENETLRREQLDQQADVAGQSVILEQRGVAEAQAGINVANASLNYAETQRLGAIDAKNDFNSVRWELLELSEAEAWANASSVDRDEQVKLTWNGNYYSSSKERRNVVLKELAYQRTRISHDLEADKLQRAIDSATAYKGIAQAQIAQAQARKAIAEQRVQIAQLQQRHAEENRDYLDMKEFSSRLWFELARQARKLSQRYLDMATEIAFLMERAYNAETERNIHVIRYDYSRTSSGNLMGADILLADVDYFTLDHVTTTKHKKAPVKKTISLADAFPMAFQHLKTKGRCFFQTELSDFDLEHPGLFLCKLRNVELLFVGITRATSIAGTLRNVGVSKFRLESGTLATRLYPSDVMPLSQYDIRQDALAFRFNPNDLRLFENNGIDTLWQLSLPLDANDFDYSEILDVQLVLYYDGFFSPSLESSVKAALPKSDTASRAFSMRLMFPDELFYLKNQGDAELVFDAGMFPRNQTKLMRRVVTLKVTGEPAVTAGLTLQLTSKELGSTLAVKTDANGETNSAAPGNLLKGLENRSMFDQWTVKITATDNPKLVKDGGLNLKGIADILIFFEYRFDYR